MPSSSFRKIEKKKSHWSSETVPILPQRQSLVDCFFMDHVTPNKIWSGINIIIPGEWVGQSAFKKILYLEKGFNNYTFVCPSCIYEGLRTFVCHIVRGPVFCTCTPRKHIWEHLIYWALWTEWTPLLSAWFHRFSSQLLNETCTFGRQSSHDRIRNWCGIV